MANSKKTELLREQIEHVDITKFDARPLIDAYSKMAFSARDLARASDIYDRMLADKDCAVILCLAGSLISAGLKKTIWQLVESNMVDAIVSTGANIVDQDFFEAIGFKHYKGSKWADDKALRARARRPHLRHVHRRGRARRLRQSALRDRGRPEAAAVFFARIY